jgi:hypothetical protein
MLLEAIAKVVGSIIASRLETLLSKVGVEYQNGFMRRRGCADGDPTDPTHTIHYLY